MLSFLASRLQFSQNLFEQRDGLVLPASRKAASTMNIKRIVPDFESSDLEGSKEFYNGFLGLDVVMDQGGVMTFTSASNPNSQITILERGCADYAQPDLSVEVDDIHHAHSEAIRRGLSIEYPLTAEVWGVTRFFVRDPNGRLVNIMARTNAEPEAAD